MKKFTKNIVDITPGLFIHDGITFENVSDQQNITDNLFQLRLKAQKQLEDTVKRIKVPPVIRNIRCKYSLYHHFIKVLMRPLFRRA